MNIPILTNIYDSVTIVSSIEDKKYGQIMEFQNVPYPVVKGKIFIIPEEQLILEINELTKNLK